MGDTVRRDQHDDIQHAGGATVSVRTSAGVDDVWRILADGFRYPGWVVGASHMRAVDASWPQPGARLHHSSGVWPLLVADVTEVEETEDHRSLVLLAKARPFGAARIAISLVDQPGGCEIIMTEDAVSPGARTLVPGWARHRFLEARNTESLQRLAALAERRTEPEADES